jgi:hypothetical protein
MAEGGGKDDKGLRMKSAGRTRAAKIGGWKEI